jgi:hypothetical protein
LPHFFAVAHIVHQIKRIPFATNKSHDVTSHAPFICSVFDFHYSVNRLVSNS